MTSFDVVVVGAGINGAATFFYLAQSGSRVALLEKTQPAFGPTGRSSAITSQFYGMPELAQLAYRGTEYLRDLEDLTGHGCDYRQVGQMWAGGPDEVDEWSELAQTLAQEGLPVEVVTPEHIVEAAPHISGDGLAIGIWESNCGYADPSMATTALVNGGRAAGGEVLLNSDVRSLLLEGERVVGVETVAGDRVGADSVVLAIGPWTRAFLSPFGVELPLTIERHAHAVVSAPDTAEDVLPFAWYDHNHFYYARPDGQHLILIGEWSGGAHSGGAHGSEEPDAERVAEVSDPDEYEEGVGLEESKSIVALMSSRFQTIRDLGIRPGYAGLYDISPDGDPIIGPVPGLEGLIVVAGTSGHGFKLGPAVGEELARLITTGEAPLLKPLGVDRLLN